MAKNIIEENNDDVYIHAEDHEILIAPGSSKNQILAKLKGEDPYLGGLTAEFLITENGKIYLSHVSSHLQLQRDVGIASCDVLSCGNLSMFIEGEERALRPVVRPKCSDLSGTSYLRSLTKRIEQFLLEIYKC